jgi:hypothetical protein
MSEYRFALGTASSTSLSIPPASEHLSASAASPLDLLVILLSLAARTAVPVRRGGRAASGARHDRVAGLAPDAG